MAKIEGEEKEPEKFHEIYRNKKNNIEDYNLEEIVGAVVDRQNQMEEKISTYIANYINPSDRAFFTSIIMNSSITSFGAKVKILSNMGVDKKLIEKLRMFLSIRNGFGHSVLGNQMKMTMTTKKGKATSVNTEIQGSKIMVMNSSGKLVSKNTIEYFKKYIELHNEINNELKKEIGRIKNENIVETLTRKKPKIE